MTALAIQANLQASTFFVAATNFQYTPRDLVITVGDTVQWSGLGSGHNVAQSNGPGDTSYNGTGFYSGLPNNGIPTFQFTFNTPGLFYYVCDFHAGLNMKGTVNVQLPPPTPTSTPSSTNTHTPTASPTATTTFTATPTASPTPSSTPSYTITSTHSPTATATPSATHSASATSTSSATSTATESATVTISPTQSATATQTPTATPTASGTQSFTASATSTVSPTATPSATASSTSTASPTATHSATFTATQTTSPSPTASETFTAGPSPSPTYTDTPEAFSISFPHSEEIIVAPNPVSGKQLGLSLFLLARPDEVIVRIYSAGFTKIIEQEMGTLPKGYNHVTFDLPTEISNGVYYLTVETGKNGLWAKSPVRKFVVLR